MKRLLGLALFGLLLPVIFFTPAVADGDIVKVMTQNQYLGADLGSLIEDLLNETDPDPKTAALEVLEQIKANNFPLRAWRFATQVALTKPDLIGLQEVIEINFMPPGVLPFVDVDHLNVTLIALAAKGQSYIEAATVENSEIEIPPRP